MSPGSLKRLNDLKAGMSEQQVRQLLGDPQHQERKGGRTILKYNLFKLFQGFKPTYIVFDENNALSEWYVDEKEFLKRQDQWIEAFKFNQRERR